MRMLARWSVLAVVMLSTVVAAQAPNLVGQWQGTNKVGKELRLVFVVSDNAAGGGLTASLYSIDRPRRPSPPRSLPRVATSGCRLRRPESSSTEN